MQTINYPLQVGAGTTRIIEAGTGPVVLLVHGLGARCDRWRSTVERLAACGYRAITYDLPGHGFASKEADGPATVPALASHLLALMDRLGITQAVLVGTSLGAHIVSHAALQAPDRVRGLGLVGALGIVPIDQNVAETIARNVRADQREQFAGKLGFVLLDPALVTDAFIEEEWRVNTAPGAIEAFTRLGAYLTDGIANDYVASELSPVVPVDRMLLIWGAQDKAVPLSVAHACRDALHGPELAIIEGSNHCPYLEQPEAFDAALVPFLSHCQA
nr:alpha/beta fold hydrolase [uncultured Lichenicoccus sp.]